MIFLPIGLFLTSCTNINGYSGGTWDTSETQQEEHSDPQTQISVEISEAFRVPERSWDLALHPDGRIFCSTQSSSTLYSWDQQTSDRDEELPPYRDLVSLSIPSENDIFYTTTEYGNTGTLSVRSNGEDQVIATQADDGTLFRWPVDIISAPDGGWLIADKGASGVFWVRSDSSITFHSVGSELPEALLYQEPYLYIAGEDGLYQIEWPNGDAENISSDPSFGLVLIEEQLWISTTTGIYTPSGDFASLPEIARPGSLVFSNDKLYVGDKIGENVWKIKLP